LHCRRLPEAEPDSVTYRRIWAHCALVHMHIPTRSERQASGDSESSSITRSRTCPHLPSSAESGSTGSSMRRHSRRLACGRRPEGAVLGRAHPNEPRRERTCHGYAEVCADTGHDDRVDIEVGELLGQSVRKKPSVAVFRTTTLSPSTRTRGSSSPQGGHSSTEIWPKGMPLAGSTGGPWRSRPLGLQYMVGSTPSTAGRAPG
jgi:hypothetical protein